MRGERQQRAGGAAAEVLRLAAAAVHGSRCGHGPVTGSSAPPPAWVWRRRGDWLHPEPWRGLAAAAHVRRIGQAQQVWLFESKGGAGAAVEAGFGEPRWPWGMYLSGAVAEVDWTRKRLWWGRRLQVARCRLRQRQVARAPAMPVGGVPVMMAAGAFLRWRGRGAACWGEGGWVAVREWEEKCGEQLELPRQWSCFLCSELQ